MFYKVTMVWWAKATSDLSETISFASQQLVSSCHGFHNHRRQQLRQLFKQSCYYIITTTLVLLSREDSWGQTASPGAPVILKPVILDSRENSHAIPNRRFALMVGAVSVLDKNEMPFSIKKQQQAWGRIFFVLEKIRYCGQTSNLSDYLFIRSDSVSARVCSKGLNWSPRIFSYLSLLKCVLSYWLAIKRTEANDNKMGLPVNLQ